MRVAHGAQLSSQTNYGMDTMDASSTLVLGYRNLVTWQRVFALADACLDLTDRFPPRVQRSLADQIRRASVSVPANIAEGHGRRSAVDYARHLRIAHGSLTELETHLLLAQARAYGDPAQLAQLLQRAAEVGRLLGGLLSSVTAARERERNAPKS